ncbi:hypothetical protein E2C01_003323 [Portunus trituberculatus]|uniref:Uncharacterized protein n=1 Tax=Portunus trituberculatus TaxID=210409 RepID=A0A5B7CPH2_PORTR|nr:hypothetical protein [Portunus trituberculatus]
MYVHQRGVHVIGSQGRRYDLRARVSAPLTYWTGGASPSLPLPFSLGDASSLTSQPCTSFQPFLHISLSFLPSLLPSFLPSFPTSLLPFFLPSFLLFLFLFPTPQTLTDLLNDGRVYPRPDKGLTPRYAVRARRYWQFLPARAGLITSFMAHSGGGDHQDTVIALLGRRPR